MNSLTIYHPSTFCFLYAFREGNLEEVTQFLEHIDPLQHKDEFNENALHKAARNGHELVVRKLLEKCPKLINETNKFEQTALYDSHVKCIPTLLEYGAILDNFDHMRKTPLRYQADNGKEGAVFLLNHRITTVSFLLPLLYKELIPIIFSYIGEDFNDLYNQKIFTESFLTAADKGNLEVVTLFLEYLDPLQHKDKDNDNETALHKAARKGYDLVISKLLENCPKLINENNSRKQTALHESHDKCIPTLLKYGASVDCLDDNGMTPLCYQGAYPIHGTRKTFRASPQGVEILLQHRITTLKSFLNPFFHKDLISIIFSYVGGDFNYFNQKILNLALGLDKSSYKITKLLLDAGALVTTEPADLVGGQSLIEFARSVFRNGNNKYSPLPLYEKALKKEQREMYSGILGIQSNASKKEVRNAYKKLALIFHPDKIIRNQNETVIEFVKRKNEAQKKFQEISDASEFLCIE